MAETKKCPKCGGTIHNKIGGMYICSQCGSAIAESDVIFDSGSSNAGSQSSGSDWSYTSFENESSGPEQTATEGKDWGYRSFESEPEKKNEKPKKAPKLKKEKVRKERKKREPGPKVQRLKKIRDFDITKIDFTLWWPIIMSGIAGICFTLILILMLVNKFKFMVLWVPFLCISAYLMFSLILWPVFDKAGEAPWKALVPVYNSYTLYEISGYKGWMFFLTLIPTVGQLLGCILGVLTAVSLSKKFGRDVRWGIIYLFLLFFIGWVMIAVTNMTYNRAAGHQKDMSPFQMF